MLYSLANHQTSLPKTSAAGGGRVAAGKVVSQKVLNRCVPATGREGDYSYSNIGTRYTAAAPFSPMLSPNVTLPRHQLRNSHRQAKIIDFSGPSVIARSALLNSSPSPSNACRPERYPSSKSSTGSGFFPTVVPVKLMKSAQARREKQVSSPGHSAAAASLPTPATSSFNVELAPAFEQTPEELSRDKYLPLHTTPSRELGTPFSSVRLGPPGPGPTSQPNDTHTKGEWYGPPQEKGGNRNRNRLPTPSNHRDSGWVKSFKVRQKKNKLRKSGFTIMPEEMPRVWYG